MGETHYDKRRKIKALSYKTDMKFDIEKTVQYKYIRYRFKKECLKNKDLERLSQEDKYRICVEAAKKTRSFTLIYIPIYLVTMLFFILGFIMNSEYRNNALVVWYHGILESVVPLINGDWGSSWNEKKGTVLIIFVKLIPILIINASPLFIPILIMANRILKDKIKLSGV